MNKEYLIKKFNNGEYTIAYAEELANKGYMFIMASGGVVLDMIFVPDYFEEGA